MNKQLLRVFLKYNWNSRNTDTEQLLVTFFINAIYLIWFHDSCWNNYELLYIKDRLGIWYSKLLYIQSYNFYVWSSLISFDGWAVVGGLSFTRFCGAGESLEDRPLLRDNGLGAFPALHSGSTISVWNASKVNWSFFEIFFCRIWRRYSNLLLVIDIPMQ